jgi:hypothetical protein
MCRLRAFENRVVRRIFGPRKDEMMGGWRKLHIEELRDLLTPRRTGRLICRS